MEALRNLRNLCNLETFECLNMDGYTPEQPWNLCNLVTLNIDLCVCDFGWFSEKFQISIPKIIKYFTGISCTYQVPMSVRTYVIS